ncbi:lipoate--protein ligase family protein [Occultella glacieicola]|uniref:Lipoate--protein ligase family protein n=1 Tax=Occultella glacieicola TaxID=2518684 RepID=A0ABY2DZQ8_9MICO|nr:lipoate--protein ligase family protein [Occultella glacieicola]TDE89636.1 lipoate--protein ligase family protein [Occultella glacieicola]
MTPDGAPPGERTEQFLAHRRAELAGADPDDPFGHVPALLHRLHEATGPVRLLHLRRPGRILAFSRRDQLHPGYAAAVEVARAASFRPVVRPVGGAFAPLHRGSLVVEHYGADPVARIGPRERFAAHTDALVEVFAGLGIDARVGPVPAEYCPGEFSVNARGVVKISGTAQRVSRNAWQVSSVIQVGDTGPLASVTAACAAALEQDVDPAVTSSVAAETGISDPGVVAAALTATFVDRGLVLPDDVIGPDATGAPNSGR